MKLGVSAACRRHGIGRALLEEVFRELFWRGVRRVTLEVRASNYPAQGLYRLLGFQQLAVRKGYYTNDGEDALVMALDLEVFQRQIGSSAAHHVRH